MKSSQPAPLLNSVVRLLGQRGRQSLFRE